MPKTLIAVTVTVLLLAGCTSSDNDGSETEQPPTPTASATAEANNNDGSEAEQPEPLNYMSVQLYDEDNFGALTASECLSATGPGEPYDNVPNATFSVMNERMEVIGVLFPDHRLGARAPTCTYLFSGSFDLSDRMLIQGPRMQQNGFPVLLSEVTDIDGDKLLVELSLGVNTEWLD